VKIVVLVKEVPATENVKIDEEKGIMIREGVESELNPLDLYAVEEAVRIKEKLGEEVEISAISMGPRKAIATVKNAIAIGCDKGYLLSDKKFAGSDTWSTAYTLSTTIKKMIDQFDLILCGERATDGETGQVGPCTAAFLRIPVLTYVSKIEKIGDGKIIAHRAIEGGYEVVEALTPVLVSVIKEINNPRIPTLKGKIKAKNADIPILKAEDIDADEDKLGLSGSPTRVVKISHPRIARKGEILSAAKDLDGAVNGLADFLRKRQVI
jgi:electron transfer flavoprotein beta subunit